MTILSHGFTPTMGDPATCGVGDCGQPWDHPAHNPADNPKWGGNPRSFVRLTTSQISMNALNEAAANEAVEVAGPKCPVGDCPQTLPHLHARQEAGPGQPDTVPDVVDALKQQAACAFTEALAQHTNPVVDRPGSVMPDWVDTLREVTPAHRFGMKAANQVLGKTIENADYCNYCDCLFDNTDMHPNFRPLRCAYLGVCADLSFDRPSHLAEHQFKIHGLDNWEIMEYLKDPWLVGEPRATWKKRMFLEHYGVKGADKIVQVEINPDPSAMIDALKAATAKFRAAFDRAVEEEAEVPADKIDFRTWWVEWVDNAAPTIQRKAAEYGSNSLAEMGRTFARAQGRNQLEDHEALEIGCMFYAKGKIERVLDAMLQGKLPSPDTWGDLMIYAAMASYIREFRQWP